MQLVSPRKWPQVLLAYAAGGALVGASIPLLRSGAVRAGMRAGIGPFAAVNLLLPLLAAVLAACYPRLWTAWAGAIVATLACNAARIMVVEPRVWLWSVALAKTYVHPVMAAAWVGYGMVGSIVAVAVRPWRSVGRPDPAHYCGCGYARAGAAGPRCPECGAPWKQ
ncbi:MAG: hypothetical protein U1A27_11295 [Phycisphaerae bacterium]